MVATYKVFGREVGSHVLAMISLGVTFGGAWAATAAPKKPQDKKNTPPINASSKEEEAFINEFLKNAEAEGQKQGAKQ